MPPDVLRGFSEAYWGVDQKYGTQEKSLSTQVSVVGSKGNRMPRKKTLERKFKTSKYNVADYDENENDIGIPNQKEAASDGFEKDGDESTFLASEFPGHTTDEDTQEPTSAADVTESHPTVLQEAEENGPSQGESPSDQLQNGERK
ncbi:hypothetical protein X801_09993 [Opisthorchis viverrini]|uniref:Uncharacterized protein n=1 Tax=Opisthorchis viverrini TaxID=6198 RepID=A0A1S8WIC6_OPIVI|nr:hypothetical protein X801_09993 [Opisthorchis viverrini]